MSSPRQNFRTMDRGRAGPCSPGFTLAEVLLVLLILVLAGVLLLAVLGRVRQQQSSERFIADLQKFSAAFQDYHRQHGVWPASTSRAVALPRGMEDRLVETNWASGSPFGGHYGWDSRGLVGLTAFSPEFPLQLTRADMLELDRRIDDGDLATGRFRTGLNGWPVYLAEDKP